MFSSVSFLIKRVLIFFSNVLDGKMSFMFSFPRFYENSHTRSFVGARTEKSDEKPEQHLRLLRHGLRACLRVCVGDVEGGRGKEYVRKSLGGYFMMIT